MQKNKLLLIPLITGLVLIVCSWYFSYPLWHHFSGDLIFNNISILYWLGFPLSLISMYLIALSFENKYLKWIMTVSCVLTFYSLFYFYNTLPTSDSAYFSGLSENFIKTHNLASDFNGYYQWPAFFILADITSAVSGFGLFNFEFILITIIGFVLSTAVYIYVSQFGSNGVVLAVLAFFFLSFNFLNYQAAPFTVAFCLLFLLFGLELKKRTANVSVIMAILFVGITFLHAFVPIFFLSFLLIKLIIFDRKKNSLNFFTLLLLIFVVVQITLGVYSFAGRIAQVFILESDYSNIVSRTIAVVPDQIDIIAQLFSRFVTVLIGLLCFSGFIFVVIKKKLRKIDKVIILTGIGYTGIGALLALLGTRTIPLIILPVSIGILYIYGTRFRSLLKYLLIPILILVVFIPIHSQYSGYPITYQTKENLNTAGFLVENYNWESNRLLISDNAMKWYITPQVQVSTIDTNYDARFGLDNITQYDCIIYSVGLEESLLENNISIESTSLQILNEYSIIYDSGFSYIAIKSNIS